jgi:hypothetical protein
VIKCDDVPPDKVDILVTWQIRRLKKNVKRRKYCVQPWNKTRTVKDLDYSI